MSFIISPYRFVSFDTDAQTFFTTAGITDPTQQNAVNDYVVGLKADGLWTKMHYIYPYVGGTASQHSYNLKDPTKFQITWNGGITHSSTGVVGNGATGYGNTGFNPITEGTALNSFTLGMYCRTDTPGALSLDSGSKSGSDFCVIELYNNGFYVVINQASFPNTTLVNTDKLITITRTASNLSKGYRAATEIFSHTDGSTGIPNQPFYLLAYNNAGVAALYSAREHALDFAATGFTPTDVTNLNTRTEAFETALSRNV
jgi:hypothetical protein